ncbi:hypothetical protein KJ742_04825 [Patescibacteria group bacterium]|nr:hypothetical protein [Patescibacteria group bacterium]MBU1683243.1 hypothetical protein [Patescibacteria group bacterium]MBU1934815.1 hypothetical protein [Patescibacteria group bacterium]
MEEEKATPQESMEEPVETPLSGASPEGEKEEKHDEIDEMTTLHERTIAALSYVGFLAIVPFYLKKDSKFCRFHGKQGLLIAMIFFFAKLLLVIDLLMDIALILQFVIFLYMGFAALSGKWKKCPWIYNRACQLEDQLSLKTKEEEAEEVALKPEQVKPENN